MKTTARRRGGLGLFAAALLAQGCSEGGGGGTSPPPLDGPEPVLITANAPNDVAGTDVEPAPPDPGGVPTRFVGLWRSDCRVDGELSVVQQLIIGESASDSGSIVYADTTCGNAVLDTRATMSLDFGERTTLADGAEAFEVDVVLTGEVRMTPQSVFAAAGLSAERLCDHDDWADGVSVDVSDCDVAAESAPLFNRIARQIYSVQDDELFVGAFLSTPSVPVPIERPTSLDYTSPLRRVETGGGRP